MKRRCGGSVALLAAALAACAGPAPTPLVITATVEATATLAAQTATTAATGTPWPSATPGPSPTPLPTEQAGAWAPSSPLPVPRFEMAAAALDGQVYVAGGFGARFIMLDLFERYDPAADTWEALPPLPEPRHHLGLAALDGVVYVTGGFNGDAVADGGVRGGAWAYDVAAGTWRAIADVPGVRAEHAMAALDGRVYVVGGVDNTPEGPRAVWVYDPAADSWSDAAAPAPYPISHAALVAAEGKLYLIGGRWAGNQRDVAIYDPATDTWTRGPDLPTARSGLTAAYVNGRVHVTGGEDIDTLGVFGQHEALDLATMTWVRLPDLPQPRHGLVSAAVNGRWHVLGGGSPGGSPYTNADVYTP